MYIWYSRCIRYIKITEVYRYAVILTYIDARGCISCAEKTANIFDQYDLIWNTIWYYIIDVSNFNNYSYLLLINCTRIKCYKWTRWYHARSKENEWRLYCWKWRLIIYIYINLPIMSISFFGTRLYYYYYYYSINLLWTLAIIYDLWIFVMYTYNRIPYKIHSIGQYVYKYILRYVIIIIIKHVTKKLFSDNQWSDV